MSTVSLIDLAPVLQSTPETLRQNLQQRGYKATSTAQSPSTIDSASTVSANEVLLALVPSRRSANTENNQSCGGFTRLPARENRAQEARDATG